MAYYHQGKYDRAIQDYGEAIRLKPDDAVVWSARCRSRAIVGEMQSALSDCNTSLHLKSGEAATLDSLGFVYLRMKNADAAIRNYNAALAVGGKTASSLYGRGLAERMKGNQAASEKDISAAKVIDPKIADQFAQWGVPPPSH